MQLRKLSLLALAAAVLAGSGAPAAAVELTAVALPGDPAPDSGGEAFFSFGEAVANERGDLAYTGGVTSGVAGLFINAGAKGRAVAFTGDTAPGTAGGTYAAFVHYAINDSAAVAFQASVSGGSVSNGLFVDSGGTEAVVALPGDTAPGTGGGTYGSLGPLLGPPSINASGDVLFGATVIAGSASEGLFVASGGTDTAVALRGDPAPGTGGFVFWSFVGSAMNDAGDVVFLAEFFRQDYGIQPGIFLVSGGTTTLVARFFDTAPGTGGGRFYSFTTPDINASGDVAFSAGLFSGIAIGALFVYSGGTGTPVVLAGDPAPGTGNGQYTGLGAPSLNDAGDLAFPSRITLLAPSHGIFAVSGGTDVAIALQGDPAPGTGAGTLSGFGLPGIGVPTIDGAGDVAFNSKVAGGNGVWGLFKGVLVPTPVPALGADGLVVAALALALAGAWRAHVRSGVRLHREKEWR